MELTETKIDTDYFKDLKKHISHNYQIADFYFDYYEDTREQRFLNKAKAIDGCCVFWDTDFYKFQNVKDIKRVNLCRDKFCFNCQSMLAIKRQSKYAPILDHFRNNYMVAHMVVTVPNCEAEELYPLLNKMYKKFPFLMRYLKGQAKVHGINFLKYGYGGAVRGLEVTQNEETKQFHPHFHCMVLLRKDLKLTGKYINSFSYDHGKLTHKFCDFEILMQKIWYLLMNDCKVTEQNIKELKEGYDISVKDSEGYYHECFKYACKGAFDETKGAFLYKEYTFKTLFEALQNRHMIQGYGKLHNFNDLDGEILENEIQTAYDNIIKELRLVENPEFKVEELDEVIKSSVYCKYISKSSLKRLILERRKQENEEARAKGGAE